MCGPDQVLQHEQCQTCAEVGTPNQTPCPVPNVPEGKACEDLQTNPYNCGACSNVCPDAGVNGVCISGQCCHNQLNANGEIVGTVCP